MIIALLILLVWMCGFLSGYLFGNQNHKEPSVCPTCGTAWRKDIVCKVCGTHRNIAY